MRWWEQCIYSSQGETTYGSAGPEYPWLGVNMTLTFSAWHLTWCINKSVWLEAFLVEYVHLASSSLITSVDGTKLLPNIILAFNKIKTEYKRWAVTLRLACNSILFKIKGFNDYWFHYSHISIFDTRYKINISNVKKVCMAPTVISYLGWCL